jgi:hypothetical protein
MDFQERVEEEAHRAKEAETKKGQGGTQSAGVVKKTKKPAKPPGLEKWKDVSWKGAAYAFSQPLPAAGKNMLKTAYLYHAIRSPNSNQTC